MSKAEAELQRQVNDLQIKCELLRGEIHNKEVENQILRQNVANLQEQLANCYKNLGCK